MNSILTPAELLVAKRAALGIALAPLSLALGVGGFFLVAADWISQAFRVHPSADAPWAVLTSLLQLLCGGLAALALFCNWRSAPSLYWSWVGATVLQFVAVATSPLADAPLALLAAAVGALMIVGARALYRLYPRTAPAV